MHNCVPRSPVFDSCILFPCAPSRHDSYLPLLFCLEASIPESMRSLILAGGVSSRMGVAKYSLPLPAVDPGTERPLLLHLVLCHHQFQLSTSFQPSSDVSVSVRDQTQRIEIEQLLSSCRLPDDLKLGFIVDSMADAGPASGLLAAYHHDGNSCWFVTGCDYPLLESAALQQLSRAQESKHAAVTCFINDEGFFEPLLAIWAPPALQVLHQLVLSALSDGRKLGPNQAIRALEKMPSIQSGSTKVEHTSNVCQVQPEDPIWIKNVNTPQDWTEIQHYLR